LVGKPVNVEIDLWTFLALGGLEVNNEEMIWGFFDAVD
jgi:hypothetical protein